MTRPLLIALALLCATAAIAQETLFTSALLPTYSTVPLPGRFGARWVFDLAIRNENDAPAIIEIGESGCSIDNCPGAPIIPAHGTIQGLPLYGPTELLQFESDKAPRIFFSLRVRNINNPRDPGVEIPVVREALFRTSTTELLNIPVLATGRIDLRLYDPDGNDGTTLHVQIYDMDTDVLLAEFSAALFGNWPGEHPPEFPGYAQLPLTDEFPAIANAARLRIALTPTVSGTRFWTFASITDTTTNQIQVVTPQ